jgi:glycopeptide antibiotics resistance protein
MLRTLALTLLVLCVVEVLRVTLASSPASVGIAHTNLHPGASIRQYLHHGSLRTQLLQLGGNMVIGAPLGFLLPQITPRMRSGIRVTAVALLFFTVVEAAQHLVATGRSFDVDDILLGTAGAVIGYYPLGRMFAKRLHPEHRHGWQRRLDRRRLGERKQPPRKRPDHEQTVRKQSDRRQSARKRPDKKQRKAV